MEWFAVQHWSIIWKSHQFLQCVVFTLQFILNVSFHVNSSELTLLLALLRPTDSFTLSHLQTTYCIFLLSKGSLPAHRHQIHNYAWHHTRPEAGSLQAHRRRGQACLGSRPARFWPEEERRGQTWVCRSHTVYCIYWISLWCTSVSLQTYRSHFFDAYGFRISLTKDFLFFYFLGGFFESNVRLKHKIKHKL